MSSSDTTPEVSKVSIKIRDELFSVSYKTFHELNREEAHGLIDLIDSFEGKAGRGTMSHEPGAIEIKIKTTEFMQRTVLHFIPTRKGAVEILNRVEKFLDSDEPEGEFSNFGRKEAP